MNPNLDALKEDGRKAIPDHGYINNTPKKQREIADLLTRAHQLGREQMLREAVEKVEELLNDEAYYTKVVDCSVVPAHLVLSALHSLEIKKD